MKLYRILTAAFLFAAIFSSFTASAQNDLEDVVYLKSGNIYRGIIIEQVPGQTLKIETIGGNVFTVQISDILKTTREKKEMPSPPSGGYYHQDMHRGDRGDMHGERYYHRGYGDSTYSHNRREFHYRNRGYFFQGQLLIQAVEGGGRLVNGYKFGKCGYLGIGVGIDMIYSDVQRNSNNSGIYLPLYLYYGGDILKRRVTPFYSIEAGYAVRKLMNNNGNNTFNNAVPESLNGDPNASGGHGGMMAGAGFGVKFYSRHRVYLSLSAHVDFQRSTNDYNEYEITPAGYYTTTTVHTNSIIVNPGMRLGFGF